MNFNNLPTDIKGFIFRIIRGDALREYYKRIFKHDVVYHINYSSQLVWFSWSSGLSYTRILNCEKKYLNFDIVKSEF